MTTVALLGTGEMGTRVAQNILKAGHLLTVYNRTASRSQVLVDAGASRADTPAEAAATAEVVISVLADDGASRDVWLRPGTGAIHGLKRGAVAIESSTLSVSWVKELARAVGGVGAGFLDAPMVGSTPQAETGSLVYLAGGPETVCAQAREVLASSATTVQRVGEVGSAMTLKLLINGLFACQVAALAQALCMSERAGIPTDRAVTILNGLATTSPALQRIGSQIVARTFAPQFPIDLVEKDLRYLLAVAALAEAPAALAATTHALFVDAQSAGYGASNISGIAQLFLRPQSGH